MMSTYRDTLSPSCAPVARHGVNAGFGGLFARILEAFRHRLELRRNREAFLNLTGLDDRVLDDIGLARTDVDTAAGLPLEINASLAVRQIAADRRARETRMRRR